MGDDLHDAKMASFRVADGLNANALASFFVNLFDGDDSLLSQSGKRKAAENLCSLLKLKYNAAQGKEGSSSTDPAAGATGTSASSAGATAPTLPASSTKALSATGTPVISGGIKTPAGPKAKTLRVDPESLKFELNKDCTMDDPFVGVRLIRKRKTNVVDCETLPFHSNQKSKRMRRKSNAAALKADTPIRADIFHQLT